MVRSDLSRTTQFCKKNIPEHNIVPYPLTSCHIKRILNHGSYAWKYSTLKETENAEEAATFITNR